MDRNRLITGVVIAVMFIVLLGYGLVQRQKSDPSASQRSPLTKFAYCSAENIRPCIVSFSLDSAGNMLVNILTSGSDLPAFYLKIVHGNGESIYECEKVQNFPANLYCTGPEMRVGEILQFLLISKSDETLLAEGNFAIVGLAMPTPEEQLTLTASPTGEQPLETVTVTVEPTLVQSTPSPSYPNPPYPNPSPAYP